MFIRWYQGKGPNAEHVYYVPRNGIGGKGANAGACSRDGMRGKGANAGA